MSENNENFEPIKDKNQSKEKNEEEEKNNKENINLPPKKINSKTDINELDKMEYMLLKEDEPSYDLSFKIILIGESGTS